MSSSWPKVTVASAAFAASGLSASSASRRNGLGSTQQVFPSQQQPAALDDISTDGRYAIYDTAASMASDQLWALPLFGERKPFPFVQGSFGAASAQFSPNGRDVAYNSNETGKRKSMSKLSRSKPADGRFRRRVDCNRCGGATGRSCSILA